MDERFVCGFCGLTMRQFKFAFVRARNRLLGFCIRVRIRLVSVKAGQELRDAFHDRAMLGLCGSRNERTCLVERAGGARSRRLLV